MFVRCSVVASVFGSVFKRGIFADGKAIGSVDGRFLEGMLSSEMSPREDD